MNCLENLLDTVLDDPLLNEEETEGDCLNSILRELIFN